MKTKKLLISLCACLVLILSIGIFASADPAISDADKEKLNNYGKILKQENELKQSTPEILENQYYVEFNRIVSGMELTGKTKSEAVNDAIESLTKREALFTEATLAGYSATDQEVDEYMDYQLESAKKAEEFNQVLQIVESSGMTLDEFMESQRDIYKKELVIEPYYESIKSNYMEENNLKELKNSDTAWRDYWNDHTNNVIEEFKQTEEYNKIKDCQTILEKNKK